jgi:hypothetical protein
MKTFTVRTLMLAYATILAGGALANETHFPSKGRTLTVKQPAECKQWRAPRPERQTNVEFPSDLKGTLKGDAALLVRIGADGRFVQVIDGIESHAGFMKAAEESVKEWTFTPALCNGQAISADARVDFEFRSEGAITYRADGSAFVRR